MQGLIFSWALSRVLNWVMQPSSLAFQLQPDSRLVICPLKDCPSPTSLPPVHRRHHVTETPRPETKCLFYRFQCACVFIWVTQQQSECVTDAVAPRRCVPHTDTLTHSHRGIDIGLAKEKCIYSVKKRGKISWFLFHRTTLTIAGNDREEGKGDWCDWSNQTSAVTPNWSTLVESRKAWDDPRCRMTARPLRSHTLFRLLQWEQRMELKRRRKLPSKGSKTEKKKVEKGWG